MRILNADQMREADRRTIQDIGIASLVLMENAGRQVVAAVESLYPDLADRRIAIVCGKGNTGGDGFVAARTLQQRGFDVSVFVIGGITEVKGDARAMGGDVIVRGEFGDLEGDGSADGFMFLSFLRPASAAACNRSNRSASAARRVSRSARR